MSAKLAVLEQALAPFVSARMRVSVVGSYLQVHDVPFVTEQRKVSFGTMICALVHDEGSVMPPGHDHQIWFDGAYPYLADGRSMEPWLARVAMPPGFQICEGVPAQYQFSNKPDGFTGYATHFEKMRHYWNQLVGEALALDPFLNARLQQRIGEIRVATQVSPFAYPDTCSVRGKFMRASQRLGLQNVAIIGVGGTGSFVLDQVAKTPVHEIHIFDGKSFESHNAFRAPGAASAADFGQPKVAYFSRMYSAMHLGIRPHPCKIDASNVEQLRDFRFVFVCLDHGPSRRLICDFLIANRIPFVDVGMDLSMSAGQEIYGTVRTTACLPDANDHFWSRAPDMENSGDGLYEENIQVAELNSLNAQLAVFKWKQLFGFYAMQSNALQQEFMTQTTSLVLDDRKGAARAP